MGIHDLSAMTWEEAAALDRSRTVLILPVGATEAHGPHLPLSTDVIISEAMARAASIRLAEAGWTAVVMPAVSYSPAPFAAGFAGTIGISHATMGALIREIAESSGRSGFRYLAIANSHLDPANLRALHDAASSAAGITVVFPDITRRPWGGRLTAEFRSGAAHAGQYETSILLAHAPSLVKNDARAALAAVNSSLSTAIRNGLQTFEAAGGPRAYFGDPAAATAEEGSESIRVLGDILAEAVLAAVAS
ncbi:MAG TPA: creatininase family protein [Longimicrobiales bacterium]